MLSDAHQLERRGAIVRILREGLVRKQQDLVRLLRKAGLDATQSSISRDLRDLGVLKASGRYVLPPDEVTRANGDFGTLAQFVRQLRRAGPCDHRAAHHHRCGAERRGRHRSRRVAGGRRHALRRRHHFHRHRQCARASRARRAPAHAVPDLSMTDSAAGTGVAHRPRLLRRPRHLVSRAVDRRARSAAR